MGEQHGKVLLVFGKAHVQGHYRTVEGQEVYVKPHEDRRETARKPPKRTEPGEASTMAPAMQFRTAEGQDAIQVVDAWLREPDKPLTDEELTRPVYDRSGKRLAATRREFEEHQARGGDWRKPVSPAKAPSMAMQWSSSGSVAVRLDGRVELGGETIGHVEPLPSGRVYASAGRTDLGTFPSKDDAVRAVLSHYRDPQPASTTPEVPNGLSDEQLGGLYRDYVAMNDHRVSAYPSEKTLKEYADWARRSLSGEKVGPSSPEDFARFVRLRLSGKQKGMSLSQVYEAFKNGQDIHLDEGPPKLMPVMKESGNKGVEPDGHEPDLDTQTEDVERIQRELRQPWEMSVQDYIVEHVKATGSGQLPKQKFNKEVERAKAIYGEHVRRALEAEKPVPAGNRHWAGYKRELLDLPPVKAKPKKGEQIALFKRIGRGLRLFFKSQIELPMDWQEVQVPVGGHYRQRSTGETEYVKPHTATRRKRVQAPKPESLQPASSTSPSWRPAGRPEVIATGQYGGSVYEFAVAPHWPHDNFHVLSRVKGWGEWEPAYAGVGKTYDDTVREFVTRHWNKDEVQFHDPVAHAYDEHLWAEHGKRVKADEEEHQRVLEAVERGRRRVQELDDALRHQKFAKAQMRVAVEGRHDPVNVSGHVVGGLIVHRPMGYDHDQKVGPAGWCVSHQASGLRLAQYDSQKEARVAAMRLSSLLDWRQDGAAIQAMVKDPAQAHTVQAIRRLVEDAYAELLVKSLGSRLSTWLGRLFEKAHVKTYARSDGTLVREHNDKRQSARPAAPGGRRPASQQPTLQWKRQGKPRAGDPKAPAPTFDATTPPEPGRIEEWLHRVNQEPDIQHAMREVLEGTPTEHLYKQEDGRYTPERSKLHDAIVASMLNPRAVAHEGQRPQVCILLGPPASGKSTALQPAARELGVEFTVINADDVKEKLPEYTGRNAGLVHVESSDVAEGMLLPHAMRANHNLLIDITGANGKKVKAMVGEFHKAGYDISIMYVHLPIEKTAARAVSRFRESGRFVPPEYIVNKVDGGPEETYNELKDDPRVSHWRRYSSDVDKGHTPIRQEQGQRPGAGHSATAVAKSVLGEPRLADLRGHGGVSERYRAEEPRGVQQRAEVDALLTRAHAVRATMLKSLSMLDRNLLSPDLDAAMRGTLLAERLKVLERIEALNQRQAQLAAVVAA